MTTLPFAFFGGTVTPIENAQISIASHSLQYGTTCFAGIRGYVFEGSARIFRLKDHHERLMNASKIMGLGFSIPYEAFQESVEALIRQNRPSSDFYIRPFLFSKDKQLAPKPVGLTFELAIYMVAMPPYFDPHRGMKLMVSSWRKFSDLSFPTKAKAGGCYVNSFLATGEAMRCGYDEALMTDQEGSIVEASVANILLSYRDRLIMPSIGSAMLEGITKRTMIDLLRNRGLEISFEKIDRSMVYTCDELILLGTAAQVSYAQSVDGREIRSTPGPLCNLLRSQFASVIKMEHPLSKSWVTEVSMGGDRG